MVGNTKQNVVDVGSGACGSAIVLASSYEKFFFWCVDAVLKEDGFCNVASTYNF